MKVLLWGCGKNSDKVKNYLKKCINDINIVAWCDKNYECIKQKDGVKVISPKEAIKLYKDKKIEAIIPTVSPRVLNSIVYELHNNGIKECYYVFENDLRKKSGIKLKMRKISTQKPSLEYFEFHVCDHCNLNCKGCLHLSNACEESFADLEQYINDIKRIREIFSAVHIIKLLGGEPLLNKELYKFIEITREIFPESELRVATNGILLNDEDKILFDCMKKNDAYFFISLYPPVKKIQDKIQKICVKNQVECVFTEYIDKFRKQINIEGGNDIEKSFKKCRERMGYCFGLRNGKLSPCIATYIHFLNLKFNKNIPVTENDELDIYSTEYDGWEFINRLYSPIPLCEFCGEAEEFEWKCGSTEPKIEDYVLTN